MKALFTLLFVLAVSAGRVGAEKRETRLDASGLEHDAQLINLRFDPGAHAIVLDNSELIEDDGPATGVPQQRPKGGSNWVEHLKKGIVVKKILMLDLPAARSGRIVFKGNEVEGNQEPLHLSLNGVEFVRPAARVAFPSAKQYIDRKADRWIFIDCPVNALRQGENEVLLWTESNKPSWYVLIAAEEEFARGSLTRTHHPNRSQRSNDGGKTWSDSRLGDQGTRDGEYSVRLSLDRYVRTGTYVSPVTDVLDEAGPLKHLVKLGRVRFDVAVDAENGTAGSIFMRSGASPRQDDGSWTAWRPLPAENDAVDPAPRRYFQWKAELSTTNPLVTPKLQGVRFSADWESVSPNTNAGLAAKVTHNGHVTRSSYPFVYENLLHPELEWYRKNARLDKIVEGATGEFEVMMRLLNWAYRIPVTSNEYSWNWNDVVRLKVGEDGMPELQPKYDQRRRDAMCLYSNQALIGALLAMGFQARHINIHSEGAAGHEVTEVWSNEFDKWVYMDATRDYYYFDPDTGVPLNLLEVHNLTVPFVPRVETWQRPFVFEAASDVAARVRIGIREGDNPFSVVEDARHKLATVGHFRIIPRNDFLSNPLPVPVHTGSTMWGWDGFLNYYDEKFPKRWEYQRYTNRAVDFYEPLNQAEVCLNETGVRGVVEIAVNTFTPGLDAYLFRFNEGEWIAQAKATRLWTLRSGKNRLESCVRNVRGIRGPVSTLEVSYNP